MDFTGLIKNISSFIASLPTTVLALLAVAVILNLLGITIKGIIKTVVGAFVLSVVLGSFGVSLPSFPQIFSFLTSAFESIKGLLGGMN